MWARDGKLYLATRCLGWGASVLWALLQISKAASPSPDPETTPFGISTSASSLNSCADWAPAISATGVKWLRGFDVFEEIEPIQGTWNWQKVDAEIQTAETYHMRVTGLLFYGVRWIPSASGMPSSNLPAWSDYASQVVTHVAGKVTDWEVWNEPPNFTNEVGTPAEYAAIVRTAYTAVHRSCPACRVGLAAESNNVNWLDQTIAAGAAGHFDYITVHPYEMLGAVDNGWEAEFMSIVPTIRKMLAARDPGRADVPIWFTELGEAIGKVNGTTTVTEAIQAQDLVKAYSMGLAQGVTGIDWFEGRDGDSGPMGLIDASGHCRLAYKAMKELIRHLGPHPIYVGWVLLHGKDYGFIFRGASAPVMVAWTPPGTASTFDFGRPVLVVNPSTGLQSDLRIAPLTNAPLLVIGVPSSLIAAAQANKTKPFPWGGDYTTSSSVSSRMGAPNLDRGLHQLYAEATSRAVIIDGVSARDCSASPGQSFTVDPNFLSYAKRPIRISAVVRRDAAGDNAGFNLKYESVSGWKSTGAWTTVPAGAHWATVSWSLTDTQFVGKWGYNFSLDSDSKANSRYYLQSVSVGNL